MLLCEKCNNYYFEEEGGCASPSVIDVFGNFFRKYKCKYYRKITYENMLNQTKAMLRILLWIMKLGHNRKHLYQIGRNRRIIEARKYYFELRDYLFNKL